jgi:VIT1/CCC1 family predicted Fe2+/Mn2+ transporter
MVVEDVRRRLLRAWRGEVEAGYVYQALARRERDRRRAEILARIAEAEASHRSRIEARMAALGIPIPDLGSVRISPWLRLQARLAPIDRMLRAREAAEDDEVAGVYGSPTGDQDTDRLLRSIRHEERAHSRALGEMVEPAPEPGPRERLDRILGREKHGAAGGWVSDAIYGANDGLAAVFGIVAGVSGATAGSRFVLTAGLAGAVASAVSMGVGAWLAARSEAEMVQAYLAQERQELEQHPAEEKEELSLFYQLKGLSQQEADELVERLARHPEAMVQTLVSEEFGVGEAGRSPWSAALAGFVSTAVGAIVPVIPFFVLQGDVAVIWAGGISLAAHFVVGVLKSLVTLRSWWSSGLEMTAAGVLVGGVTYGLGVAFRAA